MAAGRDAFEEQRAGHAKHDHEQRANHRPNEHGDEVVLHVSHHEPERASCAGDERTDPGEREVTMTDTGSEEPGKGCRRRCEDEKLYERVDKREAREHCACNSQPYKGRAMRRKCRARGETGGRSHEYEL